MIIIPAIDIKDGKVVRLMQGRFDDVTEYSQDPVTIARSFENIGSERIHVVDLDGAQTEKVRNLSLITDIAQSVNVPVEMGGGLRSLKDIEDLIAGGVSYAILGTKIIEDRGFLKEALAEFADKIIVSLDCSQGKIAQRGWTSVSDLIATDFAIELEQMGLQCIVYTDISKDGMLSGPNIQEIKGIVDAVNMKVIASGGVTSIDDVRDLLEIDSPKILGAIIGKAIYEQKLDLEKAIALCKGGK